MIRRVATAVAAVAAGLCLAGCPILSDAERDTPAVEVEDCDAEDRRNREAECGFGHPHATPTKRTGPLRPDQPSKQTRTNPIKRQ